MPSFTPHDLPPPRPPPRCAQPPLLPPPGAAATLRPPPPDRETKPNRAFSNLENGFIYFFSRTKEGEGKGGAEGVKEVEEGRKEVVEKEEEDGR